MLNLNEVSGVKSSPISKNILENSIGNNTLKDSRAYSNYEFLVDSIENGSFRAPSVILASGSGGFYPKTAEYQNNFYSAHIYGRDDYLNSWQESYRTDEAFELTYYDGSTLFREFKIDPGTGRGKIKSLETRNGNLPGQAGFTQFIMGYNADASVDDVGYYRHNFRTRHSSTNNNENAIDVFLWDSTKDSKTALGSRRVISLYSNGNFELVSGTSIFGPVNIAISTTAEKTTEKNSLAVAGKGVIYYNESKNRFRYSENGKDFKYFGSGSGGSGGIESCNLLSTAPYRKLDPREGIATVHHANTDITIKSIYLQLFPTGTAGANNKIGIAIYKSNPASLVGMDGGYRVFDRKWVKSESTFTGNYRYDYNMVEFTLDQAVEISAGEAYLVVVYNPSDSISDLMSIFSASINLAGSLYDYGTDVAYSMIYTIANFTPSTQSQLTRGAYGDLKIPSSVIPYFKIGVE